MDWVTGREAALNAAEALWQTLYRHLNSASEDAHGSNTRALAFGDGPAWKHTTAALDAVLFAVLVDDGLGMPNKRALRVREILSDCGESVRYALNWHLDNDHPSEYGDTPEVERTLIDGMELRFYQTSRTGGQCHFPHSADDLVGYVVRQTIARGVRLQHADGVDMGVGVGVGGDVAAFDGRNQYATALDAAKTYRVDTLGSGDYAVVDSLYDCGCRSGW